MVSMSVVGDVPAVLRRKARRGHARGSVAFGLRTSRSRARRPDGPKSKRSAAQSNLSGAILPDFEPGELVAGRDRAEIDDRQTRATGRRAQMPTAIADVERREAGPPSPPGRGRARRDRPPRTGDARSRRTIAAQSRSGREAVLADPLARRNRGDDGEREHRPRRAPSRPSASDPARFGSSSLRIADHGIGEDDGAEDAGEQDRRGRRWSRSQSGCEAGERQRERRTGARPTPRIGASTERIVGHDALEECRRSGRGRGAGRSPRRARRRSAAR